jgi:uncharacterized membrane protein
MAMEKMLVIVFADEAKAYEGSHALKQLDDEETIAVHAAAVIKKNADGIITVKQEEEEFPIRVVAGTAIGALVGLLEGPVALGVGAVAGALAGSIGDLHVAGVDAEFVDEVAATLSAGKCAVIADVSEEWVTPVDTRMEALGGTVFRKAKRQVEEDERAKDVAAVRAEIEQLKAEQARVRGERKAKLQARIDQLNSELEAELDEAKQRTEQVKNETEAKVKALQRKAAKAQGDIKATLDARVKRIRGECEQSEAKLKRLLAGQLREAAARLEK